MFTPTEAQLLHAFLKNAKPQAVNMEQAVREAINYQRAVELVKRETTQPKLAAPSPAEIEAAAQAAKVKEAEAAVVERAKAVEAELANQELARAALA
jgi:hypothetical protein